MSEGLRKILELSTKLGYLKTIESTTKGALSFGPLAIFMANNIYKEWFRSNVINSELNTFMYESKPGYTWQEDCQTAFNKLSQVISEQLPFGLASVFETCTPAFGEDKDNEFKRILHSQTKGYRYLVFVSEKESQKFFYQFQLKRRIWWRKFSTDPQRFQISDFKTELPGEHVQITSTFPFTTKVVETISNHSNSLLTEHGSLFEVKMGRKKMVPHVIETVCLESPAVLTYLCDAFQCQSSRSLLRLHSSLAPYKAALTVNARVHAEEKLEDLWQLARYQCLTLRKEGVHTLFNPGIHSKKSIETQFGIHDSIGIPYTIIVSAESLTDGIVGLRSRDTTLQEQVHISNLTPYMIRLLS